MIYASCFFVAAFQREFIFFRHVVDLGNLCNGNIIRVDPADAGAFPMHVQHDLNGFRRGFTKNFHEDFHHKIHGRVMVIMEDDPEHPGLLQPGLGIHSRAFSKLRLMTAIISHSLTPAVAKILTLMPSRNGFATAQKSFRFRDVLITL